MSNDPPEMAMPERTALAGRFPPGFTFGVATSAFQIEGAVRVDGRGESIWDRFCRTPGAIADASNGDVACDHFHRFEQDLDLIADLGIPAYRFSIAWPRVQPAGEGPWSESGFEFYDRLISGLARRGIEAHVTLYHWDLPQALEERGGWRSRDTAQHFAHYAAEVGRRFGNRVKTISTLNEPWVVAILGHDTGVFAPGERNRASALRVAHNLLLGHGLAIAALREQSIAAKLGIVLNMSPVYPQTDCPSDRQQARIDYGRLVSWYLDPLLTGAYPADIVAYYAEDAPPVAPGDLEVIRARIDFLGVNYYTRGLASAGPNPPETSFPLTDMGWEIYPEGLADLLRNLKTQYSNLPPIYITENGAAFPDTLIDGHVDDVARVHYLASHLKAVADAIESGVDVRGYFVWSLLDNFEWASGYVKRFGIVYVDYATLTRVAKRSALWYRDFLEARGANGGDCRHQQPRAQGRGS